MSRFFATPENIKGNLVYIDGREAHHILKVMRLREAEKVVVFDGTGKEYAGFIKETKPKSLIVEIVSVKKPKVEAVAELTLAQSIPKKDRMDYIVEKATELGIHKIIPIISKRTVVRFDENGAAFKVTRWKRIAKEASKQCGRTDVPDIEKMQNFSSVIRNVNNYDLALMAWLSENTIDLRGAISGFHAGKIIVFIGPEGDFTPEEAEMAKYTTCKFVSLGKRVLKSDTASLYILSVLNHELLR